MKQETSSYYSIGQLARLTGVSVRSLRHYEQSGLLAAKRTPAGYRVFAPQTPEYVRRIQVLLRNGFTLEQIRPVASMFEIELKDKQLVCADVIRLYHSKLAELDARIAELAELRQRAAARLIFLEEQRLAGGP